MVQQPVIPPKQPADFDHYVVRFPTRYADYVPTEPPAQSASHPGFGVLPTPDGGKVVWALR